MATRNARAKDRETYSGLIMPDLNPRDPDVKYTGSEPIFSKQPDPDRRNAAMIVAFNWYSRYCDTKIAKEQLALYVENFNPDNKTGANLARQLRRVDDREVIASYGWLARLAMRGLTLTETEQSRLGVEIDRLLKTKLKAEPAKEVADEVKSNKPNVQEIMRERTREAAGDLEGLLDEFVTAGAKTNNVSVNPVGVLTERNILPQHISMLREVWKKKLTEFQNILDTKDPQIIEGYSQYTRHQIKAIVKFCEAVLTGLDSYINVKKASKTPRKRKPVSVEKQSSKIKFLKTFDELKLTSVHPGKLIGASEAWLYDTAKRKLWYLVADSHVGVLGVKGATILGYDTSKSGVKTVRKPSEVIKKLMAAGKPAARKLFTEINSVQAQPNGRTNENLIILKVY